ncbi:hypothetical protein [Ensifer aridi]|uniref:hypothetical protein n=1 Tax=Ensifer aridi TaxID=1708715 RepID=UPI0015E393A3|nr:hypothetical protein [Ensifer aridi]
MNDVATGAKADWEVEAALAGNDEDAGATIATLLLRREEEAFVTVPLGAAEAESRVWTKPGGSGMRRRTKGHRASKVTQFLSFGLLGDESARMSASLKTANLFENLRGNFELACFATPH